MMNMFFDVFNLTEGFGINTNIFDTNIINLAIVISFVGDALKSLLKNREQLIIANIQEAEKREKEAIEKLNSAKNKLINSQQKVKEISDQSFITAQTEKEKYKKQTVEDIERLQKLKQETILFQQQKAIKQISKQVITLALNQVYKKIENRYDGVFQNSVNNFYLALFRNYQK
uniref:ATP synthase subunit b, chloroplastic n=1 Tax=Lambia antarctica TaxID=101717 RepID=A0A1L2EDX1_9CHLO|nr:ATP synthase subunit b [Lambia antarctica]ANN39069.1 ATP synthase subunit b [Lambia antarctica]